MDHGEGLRATMSLIYQTDRRHFLLLNAYKNKIHATALATSPRHLKARRIERDGNASPQSYESSFVSKYTKS